MGVAGAAFGRVVWERDYSNKVQRSKFIGNIRSCACVFVRVRSIRAAVMAQKTVLVFGVSGIVGEGAAKALLDKGLLCVLLPFAHRLELVSLYITFPWTGYRVVAVFRSVESAQKAKERLNNPPEEKLVTVIGELSKQSSDRATPSSPEVSSSLCSF